MPVGPGDVETSGAEPVAIKLKPLPLLYAMLLALLFATGVCGVRKTSANGAAVSRTGSRVFEDKSNMPDGVAGCAATDWSGCSVIP